MQRRGMIKDQFVQSFPRPYGHLWQQAVLVDASPTQVTNVANDLAWPIARERRAWSVQRRAWFWSVGRRVMSVSAVMVAVLLAYVFANAATKGYYEWALRVAAVVLVGGGLLLVLMVS